MKSKKHTLAEILRLGLSTYCDSGKRLSEKQWKVVNSILSCHTEQLGGYIYKCDSCSDTELHYHSCRDRHCPSCQSLARSAWIEKRSEELLPTGYFHVVFTLPEELNQIAHYNKSRFYSLMFSAVSSTLQTLGRDPKWLGGTIGAICILHTWGQTLIDHPHIHCIIPGGGIRTDGKKWKSFRDKYLFPVKVMSLLYRRIFMGHLENLVSHRDFSRPPQIDKQAIHDLIGEMKKKQWVVYVKEPFTTAKAVIKYLGNYTHRIAIAQSRILEVDEKNVIFKYKDHRDEGKQKIMKLETVEFIRRFLLHILPDRFVRIRYFGFLSNRSRTENIKKCMMLLGKKYQVSHTPTRIKDLIKSIYGIDISRCKKCGHGHYITYMILERKKSFQQQHKRRYYSHRGGECVKYRETTSFNKQSMQSGNLLC